MQALPLNGRGLAAKQGRRIKSAAARQSGTVVRFMRCGSPGFSRNRAYRFKESMKPAARPLGRVFHERSRTSIDPYQLMCSPLHRIGAVRFPRVLRTVVVLVS
jgi:hypothetical protein